MTLGPPKAVRHFGANLTPWYWNHRAEGPVLICLELGECGIHTARPDW